MSISGRTSILHGAMLTVGMRWADRLIGLVSTLILARLLAPDDLGIIAMSALVIGLADMLLDLGVEAALIQNRDAQRGHYDSAWTIRLLQMCLSAALVVAAAPLAAAYFDEPRVLPVLQVTAASLVLGGLENIGIVTFRKEMRFGKDFQFVFLRRIFGFAVTMLAAAILRNYWALVLGALSGRMLGVVLSYVMHPMRPRLSFVKVREIFGFSQWMLIQGLGRYLDTNVHRFLVGGRDGSAVLGGYSVGGDIAGMPSNELLMPLNRVLFPAFVEVKGDERELRRKFLLAQGVQTALALPASVGLALVARDAVPALLGSKWEFAVPFVQLLAIASVIRALSNSSSYLMLTLGKVKHVAGLAWFQVLMFTLIAFVVVPTGGALELAAARGVTASFGIVLSFWLLLRALPVLSVGDLMGTALRPVVASALMSGAILALQHLVAMPPMIVLPIKIVLGMLAYAGALWMMWYLSGKPSDGPEAYLIRTLWQPLARRLSLLIGRHCDSATSR